MDFGKLLSFASDNQKSSKESSGVRRFTTKLSAPKKEVKTSKGVNSAAVRAFLERKEKELDEQKKHEAKKKEELLKARKEVRKNVAKANAMASRTKDNLKIVVKGDTAASAKSWKVEGPDKDDLEKRRQEMLEKARRVRERLNRPFDWKEDEETDNVQEKSSDEQLKISGSPSDSTDKQDKSESSDKQKHKDKHKDKHDRHKEKYREHDKHKEKHKEHGDRHKDKHRHDKVKNEVKSSPVQGDNKKPDKPKPAFKRPPPRSGPPPLNFDQLLQLAKKKQDAGPMSLEEMVTTNKNAKVKKVTEPERPRTQEEIRRAERVKSKEYQEWYEKGTTKDRPVGPPVGGKHKRKHNQNSDSSSLVNGDSEPKHKLTKFSDPRDLEKRKQSERADKIIERMKQSNVQTKSSNGHNVKQSNVQTKPSGGHNVKQSSVQTKPSSGHDVSKSMSQNSNRSQSQPSSSSKSLHSKSSDLRSSSSVKQSSKLSSDRASSSVVNNLNKKPRFNSDSDLRSSASMKQSSKVSSDRASSSVVNDLNKKPKLSSDSKRFQGSNSARSDTKHSAKSDTIASKHSKTVPPGAKQGPRLDSSLKQGPRLDSSKHGPRLSSSSQNGPGQGPRLPSKNKGSANGRLYASTNDNVLVCKPTKKSSHQISDEEEEEEKPQKKKKEPVMSTWDRIYGQVQKNKPKPNPKKRPVLESEDESDYYDEDDDFIDDEDDNEFIDDSAEGGGYSKYIKEIFGYDKSRYRDEDDDLADMEANFSEQMKEEARSARLGLMEDLEDIRQEEARMKRKLMKKKPRRF